MVIVRWLRSLRWSTGPCTILRNSRNASRSLSGTVVGVEHLEKRGLLSAALLDSRLLANEKWPSTSRVRPDLAGVFEPRSEQKAFLDILADLSEHVLKERVLLLLAKNVDALNKRQTGVDHDGKLTRENGQLLCLDLFAAADLWYRDFASLFRGLRHHDLFAPEQCA